MNCRQAQAGFVLQALLFGLLGLGAALNGTTGDSRLARLKSAQAQQRALAQAREALIARAVNDASRPGSLPCPALLKQYDPAAPRPGDGRAELMAGNRCPSLIGRLPWSTLDLPQPLDDNLNTLWYVVAPGLRDHRSASPINSDTPTGLSLNGEPEVAALILLPGPQLPGQRRPSNDPADYLEGNLSTVHPADFSSRPGQGNDRLLSITRHHLMAAVELGVARRVRHCLAAHRKHSGRQPWPAPLASTSGEAHPGSRFGRIPRYHPDNAGALLTAIGLAAADERRPLTDTQAWAGNLATVLIQAADTVGRAVDAARPELARALAGNGQRAAAQAALAPLAEALAAHGFDPLRLQTAPLTDDSNLSRDALLAALASPPADAAASLDQLTTTIASHALAVAEEAATLRRALAGKPDRRQLQTALAAMPQSRLMTTGKALPMVWAAAACDFLAQTDSWWQEGNWSDGIFFQLAASDAGETVVIAAGPRIGKQQRPSSQIADYLEGVNADPARNGNAEAATGTFEPARGRSDHNDQVVY